MTKHDYEGLGLLGVPVEIWIYQRNQTASKGAIILAYTWLFAAKHENFSKQVLFQDYAFPELTIGRAIVNISPSKRLLEITNSAFQRVEFGELLGMRPEDWPSKACSQNC